MRVRKQVGYTILAGIGVVSMSGLLGVTWVYANFANIMEDQQIQGEMIRLQGSAKLYHRRLETFQGVCRDIGVPSQYDCNEDGQAFAISVENVQGLFYCIDNSGHFGEQILPIRNSVACSK